MISYFDSTGVQLLKDGNGYVEWKSGDWLEKGKYVAGFKDSIWTGENLKSGTRYKEVYTDKKMLSGTTFKGGKTYTYSEGEGMPIYPGGLKEFYKFVGKTYRYPLAAVKRGTTGRVLLSFVVEKDGSITDIKIIKDIGFGTGREAARVMRNSPNWIPGTQRGLPVRVQYTLPIVLAL